VEEGCTDSNEARVHLDGGDNNEAVGVR